MILMPGPVIEAHAEEEKNCDACHSGFDKSAQQPLCLECHEAVAGDMKRNMGFHGRSPTVTAGSCRSCHKEHRGRDYNSIPLDPDTFDHRNTDFALQGRHGAVACGSCHRPEKLYRDIGGECSSCHGEQDPHRGALGEDCGDCHNAEGWRSTNSFDHGATEFPLLGGHESLSCASCHAGETFTFDRFQCIDCHRVKDVHLGSFGEDCALCHSESDWSRTQFDHAAETDFELSGAHSELACQSCHHAGVTRKAPGTQCQDCHNAIDVHAGRHGTACEGCHNERRWSTVRFDHSVDTRWPLQGRHRELTCLQCHQGTLDDDLSGECRACHRGDDVHRSADMEECGSCHSPERWNRTAAFDHELSRFPLEGLHALATCQACHQNHQFKQTTTACIDCHRADDQHEASLGPQCETCHTPNGWTLWSFDHDTHTNFILDGAHAQLSCNSCHRGSTAGDVSDSCAGCHSGDDRHGGGFGDDCGRCHSSESFGDIQWPR